MKISCNNFKILNIDDKFSLFKVNQPNVEKQLKGYLKFICIPTIEAGRLAQRVILRPPFFSYLFYNYFMRQIVSLFIQTHNLFSSFKIYYMRVVTQNIDFIDFLLHKTTLILGHSLRKRKAIYFFFFFLFFFMLDN